MAMLAEPRRRKRYNLVPKGKALFEDNDRFGTKMLEKMGWSKGKGLGAREHGQQEFVRVRYKNDANGLGYEERDDQWTEHEKHFTGLLETLNSNSNTNSDEGDESAPAFGFGFEPKTTTKKKLRDKFSGQSLEEKSKNSKARVHYKKFTKGKDISQYSEKDLANIFGKKATPDDTNIYSQFPTINAGSAEKQDADEKPATPPTISEGNYLINTGISVNDYFKQKMEALKKKRSAAAEEKENEDLQHDKDRKRPTEEGEEEVPRKKKKNKHKEREVDTATNEEPNVVAEDPIAQDSQEEPRKKKKKSKKLEEDTEEIIVPPETVNQDNEVQKKKKSKKLQKPTNSVDEVIDPTTVKETKKTPKSTETIDDSNQEADLAPPKKKKKKKSSETTEPKENGIESVTSGHDIQTQHTIDLTQSTDNKHKEKKIETKTPAHDTTELPIATPNTATTNKKKKKKKSSQQDNPIEPIEPVNPPTQSKSKKNKTQNQTNQSVPHPTEVSSVQDINSIKDDCCLDIYTISTFCAEKFRNIELPRFRNSNIAEINGYGLSENLQLNIKSIKDDKQRIMKLWSGVLDKYQNATPKSRLYRTYMKKAKQARKAKQRIPKMKFKSLKRKDIFQGL